MRLRNLWLVALEQELLDQPSDFFGFIVVQHMAGVRKGVVLEVLEGVAPLGEFPGRQPHALQGFRLRGVDP